MSNAKIDELSKDVEELKKLSDLATRSKVKDILFIETRKIETEIIKLKEIMAAAGNTENCKTPSQPVSNHNPIRCYDVRLTNYAWDQSDKFVKIFVDLTGVHEIPSENVTCKFSSGEMTLLVSELNNRNYTLSLKNLFQSIQPNTSHWKVKKDKVIVFMHKGTENRHWNSLHPQPPVKDKLNDMNPNADPSEHMMSIMKDLYENGNDEMKRNIAKAWSTSNNKQDY